MTTQSPAQELTFRDDPWKGFTAGPWQTTIDVRDFILTNFTPYTGDASFLSGPTAKTLTVWETLQRDYLSVAGGTVDQIGLNFRPFYRFAEKPNAFHVLGIHTSPMGFVSQLPRIWRASPMKPGHTYEAVTTHATIRSPRAPLRYMIDGDLHECGGPLHVSIGPRVRIVVGT